MALIRRLLKSSYDALFQPADAHSYYEHLMEVASNYEQWAAAALILDQLQGKEQWKLDPRSSDYDYQLVDARLAALKKAREANDLAPMIFMLRTTLFRNLGDMGKPTLFATANIGTKKLIEDYIDEVVKQLHLICDTESPDMNIQQKLEFFINTRQSFGRTALMLSGGATLGLHHIGVVKCLYECKLLPRIISGTSSGSIIGAIICTKTDDDLKTLMRPEANNLNFYHEANEPDNIFMKVMRLLKSGVLFDVEVLRQCIRDNVGDITFQEAYNRTRRILNISVSSSGIFEMPRLLNYVTAPNVIIWSAVAASCAIPFVYSSAPLMAKEKGNIIAWNPSGHRWIDGSVESDLPMVRLAEIFNVNHFIVSQVNPHIVPFLHTGIVRSRCRRIIGGCLNFARRFVQHYVNYGIEFDICPELFHRIHQLLSQKYYGDITIVPKVNLQDYLIMIENPTDQTFVEACLRGERATWPKMSLIKNHLQIELAIDEVVCRLRARLLDPTLDEASTVGQRNASSSNSAHRGNDLPHHHHHHTSPHSHLSSEIESRRDSCPESPATTTTTTATANHLQHHHHHHQVKQRHITDISVPTKLEEEGPFSSSPPHLSPSSSSSASSSSSSSASTESVTSASAPSNGLMKNRTQPPASSPSTSTSTSTPQRQQPSSLPQPPASSSPKSSPKTSKRNPMNMVMSSLRTTDASPASSSSSSPPAPPPSEKPQQQSPSHHHHNHNQQQQQHHQHHSPPALLQNLKHGGGGGIANKNTSSTTSLSKHSAEAFDKLLKANSEPSMHGQ